MSTLLRVSSNYFVAGLVLENSRVQIAAPILAYMRGWLLVKVKEYCRRKGWLLEQL